jgi:uncharacterized protein DUF1707/cell wall-active antibiotic response 4TMS protein YvqF
MDNAPLRASDDDREHAVIALREHLVAGRLTLEEFCERVDAALRARDTGDLAHLQNDLPEAWTGSAGSRRLTARLTAALLSHVVRRGKFRLRGQAVAASICGDLDFDLRDAIMDEERAVVTVLAAFGNVDIYVPEGVNVDVAGLTVFGHRRDFGHDAGQPDAPSIHVRVFGFAGTVDVWRVPRDMRGSSYGEIVRAFPDRRPELPA